MKIKRTPEDFSVKEILNTPILPRGPYILYILEKRESNTIDVLSTISKKLSLPFSCIGYGGRKDKHALTQQYITIKGHKPFRELKERDWSIKNAGFLDRPMGPDLIESNSFDIVIRDLTEEQSKHCNDELEKIKTEGFINYFDDQRFGTFDPLQGFMAEKLIKKHFNGALKIYLTKISSEDDNKERERKKFFFDNWGDWNKCLSNAKTTYQNSVFNHLLAKPKDFIPILRRIPQYDLSLYFSAYQAYLWNEVVRRFVKSKVKNMTSHKGAVGNYLFYDSINTNELEYWQKITVPTASSKMDITNPEIASIYEKVFEENNIKRPQFNLTKIRQSYFKSHERNISTIPLNMEWKIGTDTIYPGRNTISLKFLLSRGSYATMLIKRLFATQNH